MKIDVHVHLAGVGTAGSGCWISDRFMKRATIRLLQWSQGITPADLRESVDQDWVERVAEQVRESELDRAVVLGFDGVYDSSGRFDERLSQLVVPAKWVFESCRRYPGELLPGPSINPSRADAMEVLDECIEKGAVLIKWLPATQDIDPSSRRLQNFYRRVVEAGIPLLIHSGGGENVFREIRPELKSVEYLRYPLEEGVTVICAHSGTPVHLSRDPDQTALVRDLLERFPHFWVDNSGMANPSRFSHLARLAKDPLYQARTLNGSDFPVPTNAVYYTGTLGAREVWRLERIRNPFDRDVMVKRALGYPDETLARPAEVLANLDRWSD